MKFATFFLLDSPKKLFFFFLLLLFSRDVHGQLFFLFDQLMHDENSCWCHQMKKLIFFSFLFVQCIAKQSLPLCMDEFSPLVEPSVHC